MMVFWFLVFVVVAMAKPSEERVDSIAIHQADSVVVLDEGKVGEASAEVKDPNLVTDDYDSSRQSLNGYPVILYGNAEYHHFTKEAVKAAFDLYSDTVKRKEDIWRRFQKAGRAPRWVGVGKFDPWAWTFSTYFEIAEYKGSHVMIVFDK